MLRSKLFSMGSLSVFSLITIVQYVLFGGIILVLFGWFEKKEKLAFAANALFILIGFFAIWILFANIIVFQANSSSTISKEMKTLSLLKLSIWFAAFNLISLLLGIFRNKYYKPTLFIVVLAALCLFFIAFNLLQIPTNQ